MLPLRRKIIVGSTPTFTDTSNVLKLYGESDKRIFEVPCPSCGAFTEIMWQHTTWPKTEDGRDLPDEVKFECPHCKNLIEEHQKLGMVTNGQWRATQA